METAMTHDRQPTDRGSTKVLLADDHPVVVDGIRQLIAAQSELEVVAIARDGEQAVELSRELRPQVVVLDLSMPKLSGITALQRIREDCRDTRVIVLSMHTSRQMVADSLAAGACGYVTKHSATGEIIRAIHETANGAIYLSSDVRQYDLPEPAPGRRRHAHFALSTREREVLQQIAEGKSTKQIAAALSLSEHTINRHRVRIMDKLGVRTVAELTKYAIKEGLSPLD
jgi:DNA-binding NarL/FixJ family response regulator